MKTSTLKWYPMGHDFGNTDIIDIILMKGEEHRASCPTAFCRIDATAIRNLSQMEMPQQDPQEKKGGKGKGKAKTNQKAASQVVRPDYSTIQIQGESITYAVGDFALSQGKKVWTGRGDHGRYASKYSVRGLLERAASVIPDKEFGLYVVTGLPADLFVKSLDLRKQIKEELDGMYTFSTDGGETWRTAHVEISLVVMEGAGALLAYSTKMKLTMTKSTMAACIDIGGGTVDLYAARGATPIAEYCKSDRYAVEAAAQLVRDIFTARYPGRGLTDLEVREIMYAFANNANTQQEYPYPQVSVFGEAVETEELEEIAGEAIEQVAEDIVTFVLAAWREADGGARFDPLLLVGGGYYYFLKNIKARIPHIQVLSDDDLGDYFPTDANAKGYVQLAARRLAKKEAAEKEAALLKEQEEQHQQQVSMIAQEEENPQLLLEEEELQHAAASQQILATQKS